MRTRHWEVSDELWERVRQLIPPAPSHAKGGRPRLSDRTSFEAIVYMLHTGIQWNALPKEAGANPTDHGKQRTMRSVLTDGAGIPLALMVDGVDGVDGVKGRTA